MVYPPLTESPSPLLPSNANLSEDSVEEPEPQVVPEVVVLDGWMEKHLKKEELIKILREQRAKNPNDPFALSEETIDELSKIEDIAIQ